MWWYPLAPWRLGGSPEDVELCLGLLGATGSFVLLKTLPLM